jgi:SAM-dependent methyltransferase
MTRENKCLVCSSTDTALKFSCKDHLTGGEDFDVYTCRNCGFVFTANPPPENDTGKYYDAGDYISHSDTKKGLTNRLYHFTRNLMLFRKRDIIRKATGLKTGTLLDIGCGTGYFAAFMKDAGWKVTGMEVNEKASNFAKEKFNLEVVNDPDLLSPGQGCFDCITLWHVFEHFYDPLKCIVSVRRLLKPGGKCIIAMPNCSSFDARHYGRFWAAWDVPRHLWHFTPETLRTFSEKNGFVIDPVRSLPADVFYISILSERYRGTNLPFITGIVTGLWFAVLASFCKKRTSSLIYILDLIP